MKQIIGVTLVILVLAAASSATGRSELSPEEAKRIQSVLVDYRAAWLKSDQQGVLRAFTPDAVLMPHHGVEPVTGIAAIREFWFPVTTSQTTIDEFKQTYDEIGGGPDLAYVRGKSEVSWTTTDGKTEEVWRTKGNYLAVLKRQTDGGWRISHLIWDDIPNERIR